MPVSPPLARPIALAGALAVLLLAADARAIPAFARKYRTSCQTCHTQYPRLNPFGEAYRLSGYQYPEQDEDTQKGRPLDLGSDRYEDLFPDAVWPGRIMESVPLSIRAQGALRIALPEEAGTAVDFQVPAGLALNGAGTLTEDIALWAGMHVMASGDVAAEKVVFVFSNLFDFAGVPRHLLNLRVGQFEPESQPFSPHRQVGLTGSSFAGFRLARWAAQHAGLGAAAGDTAAAHGHLVAGKADASHAEEPAATDGTAGAGTAAGAATSVSVTGGTSILGLDRGIELYGVIASRLLYAVGVFNGNGAASPIAEAFDPNTGKDVTGRLQVKLGGMAFDGTGDVDEKSWRELSVAVGAFTRWGEGTLTRSDTGAAWDSEHLRVGADLDIRVSDFEIVLAAAWDRDANPLGDGIAEDAVAWYGEVYTVWLPWLQSSVRYEAVAAGGDKELAAQDVAATLSFLVVPNFKALVEASFDLTETSHFPSGDSAVLVGIDGAF